MQFYILLIIIQISSEFELFLEKEKEHLIAKNEVVDIRFQEESVSQSLCHPSKLFVESSDNKYTKFVFHNDEQKPINITITSVIYDGDILEINYAHQQKNMVIEFLEKSQFIMEYKCQITPDSKSWSLILFEFAINFNTPDSQSYSIQFYKQCKQSEQFLHPLIILLILAVTLLIIGTHYGLREIKIMQSIKTEEFTAKTSVLFIFSASILLFSLFKFPEIGQIILSIVMFFMSLLSIQVILEDLLQQWIKMDYLLKFITYSISLTLVGFYFYTKYWILNNIIAFVVTLLMFKIIEIDSLKTGVLLLSMAFFYDIFWVFISPVFFGTSVMASVATQIDLPMKFICPSLVQSLNTPLLKCSLLGLGDILLPGIIIKYILKYETMANKGFGMYIVSIIGYTFGLLICIISLVGYKTAQPALLYLVPFILIPVLISSIMKKQFHFLWKGQVMKNQKQTGGQYELQQSEQV